MYVYIFDTTHDLKSKHIVTSKSIHVGLCFFLFCGYCFLIFTKLVFSWCIKKYLQLQRKGHTTKGEKNLGGDLSHTLNKVISSDGHLRYIYGEEPNLQECFTQVFSVKKTWICCSLSDDSFMLLNTYSFNNEPKFLKGSETIDEEDFQHLEYTKDCYS